MRNSHNSGFRPSGVIFCAFFTFAAMAWAGTYSGGSGTAEDPYKISTVADLIALGNTPSDYGKCFVLTADIDLTGKSFTRAVIAPDRSTDYYFQGTPFTGTFDGGGHILSNLMIRQPTMDYIGLLGRIEGGQVRNLGLVEVNILGYSYVGGLCGHNWQGTISSCYATGTVTGNKYDVGGLCGENLNGTIASCYATGTVTGDSGIGGLCGYNHFGTITSCYATGAVMGYEDVGGLCGINWFSTITSCFWDIESSGQTGSSGGKGLTSAQMKTMSIYQNAGWAGQGWILNAGADTPRLNWENTQGEAIPAAAIPFAGSGTAQDPYRIFTAGDFAALSWYAGILDRHIRLEADLEFSGLSLSPIGDLGPFTGVFDGARHVLRNAVIDLPNSEEVGVFSRIGWEGQVRNLGVVDVNIRGYRFVGGLCGEILYGTITSCYATGTVTGDWDVGGLCGENLNGTIASCYATGAVTGKNEYVGGLCGLNSNGTIASCYVTGTVMGSGSIGGLCGWNDSGTITSCYATGTVTGDWDVGGLNGVNNYGTIASCYATGAVTADQSVVGGLCGYNDYGTITSSYATGTVTGNWDVGGLCGENEGSIATCYATGAVTGKNDRVGGLCGYNDFGSITTCYVTGTVTGDWDVGGLCGLNSNGSIATCFWDIETSGQTASDGGTGKTTTEMKELSTFTGTGWDFVGESANGTGDVWRMCADGVSYPRLSWEFSRGGDMSCPDGVELEDFLYLAERWMANTPATVGAADADGDGKVDLQDFAAIADNWMR